jgi:hypothetical protein
MDIMKTRLRPIFFRGTVLATLVASLFSSVSCMTTYDANGRPVQSVDPGLAVAGVAAAGLLGYALNDRDDHHHYRGRPAPRHYDRRRY